MEADHACNVDINIDLHSSNWGASERSWIKDGL